MSNEQFPSHGRRVPECAEAEPKSDRALARRTLLLRTAQGLGGATIVMAGAAAPSTPSKAQDARHSYKTVATVASVKLLGEVEPDEILVYAQGLEAPDDGAGGLFSWQPSTSDTLADDGIVHVASRTGAHGSWARLDYDGVAVRPEWFGSLAYSHDHAMLIQKAIDHVSAMGGGRVELGSRSYRCMSRIDLDPTLCSLSASAAVLDFSERKLDILKSPEVSLNDLVSAATDPWSFEKGALSRKGHNPVDLVLVCDLPAQTRCRAEIDVGLLEGDPNNPFLRIEISGEGAASPFFRLVLSSAGHVAFEFDAPGGSCVVTLSSNCDLEIADFRIVVTGQRECLLIRCRSDGTQYGHTSIGGLRIYGPGRAGYANTGFEGIRFETVIDARASRLAMRDVIVEGFETALVMSHRCYLAQFYSCRFVGPIGVLFLAGSDDAGENISFFGCAIGAGKIGIWNGGAELNLFGSSVNFCEQFYVGIGKFHATGCHFETNRLLHNDQYLFDIGKGSVSIDGGTVMVSGRGFEKGNQADYIVMCRSRLATFIMQRTACYNLRTRTEIFCGGQGTVRLREITGDARKFVAPILKRDLATNLFGMSSRFQSAVPIRLTGSQSAEDMPVVELVDGERVLVFGARKMAPETECWLPARCVPNMRVSWSLDVRHMPDETGVTPHGEVLLDILFCQFEEWMREADEPSNFVVAKRPIQISMHELGDWKTLAGSTHDTREDEWADGSAPAFASHVVIRLKVRDLDLGSRLLVRAPYAGAV